MLMGGPLDLRGGWGKENNRGTPMKSKNRFWDYLRFGILIFWPICMELTFEMWL